MQRAASCAICTEFYSENDSIVNTKCGHVFHEHCFENWKIRSNQCAQCRAHTTKAFRIYLIFGDCETEDASVGRSQENIHENIKLIGDLVKGVNEAIESLKEAKTTTQTRSPQSNDPVGTVFADRNLGQQTSIETLLAKIKTLEDKQSIEKSINENIKLLKDVVQCLDKNIERLKDSENNNTSNHNNTSGLHISQNTNQIVLLQSGPDFDADSYEDDDDDDSYGDDDSFGDHESYDVEQQSQLESDEENIYDLLHYAKQLKNYGYKSVYLNRGRVTVRRQRNSEPIYIENSDMVYQLMCSSEIENDSNLTESDYDDVDDDEEDDDDDEEENDDEENDDDDSEDDDNEDDFEEPYELFQYAKNLKRYGYKSVYLSRGTVIVRQQRNSRPIYIRNRDHVNELMDSAH